MRDEPDAESLAGRLRGIYGNAEQYVQDERESWVENASGEPPHERRRMSDELHDSTSEKSSSDAAADDISQDGVND